MKHVIRIPHKCHKFFHQFVTLKKEGRELIFTGKFPIKQKLSPLTEVVYYIKNPFPGNFPFYPKFLFNHFPIIRSTLYYKTMFAWLSK